MVISKSNKFLFISIPKTGSSTLRRLLSGYQSVKRTHKTSKKNFIHSTCQQLIEDNKINEKEYFKFAFVRNPWDRVLSEYLFHKKRKGCRCGQKFFSRNFPSFKSFLRKDGVFRCGYSAHGKQQYEFITNQQNQIIVDFVGRFDRFEEDLKKVFNTLNINIPNKIPRANQTRRIRPLNHYYCEETVGLVKNMYEKDVELFNFKPPEVS